MRDILEKLIADKENTTLVLDTSFLQCPNQYIRNLALGTMAVDDVLCQADKRLEEVRTTITRVPTIVIPEVIAELRGIERYLSERFFESLPHTTPAQETELAKYLGNLRRFIGKVSHESYGIKLGSPPTLPGESQKPRKYTEMIDSLLQRDYEQLIACLNPEQRRKLEAVRLAHGTLLKSFPYTGANPLPGDWYVSNLALVLDISRDHQRKEVKKLCARSMLGRSLLTKPDIKEVATAFTIALLPTPEAQVILLTRDNGQEKLLRDARICLRNEAMRKAYGIKWKPNARVKAFNTNHLPKRGPD